MRANVKAESLGVSGVLESGCISKLELIALSEIVDIRCERRKE